MGKMHPKYIQAMVPLWFHTHVCCWKFRQEWAHVYFFITTFKKYPENRGYRRRRHKGAWGFFVKSRSIPGFLALDTKQKSFFPSCLGLCLQRLLKAAAWVRPNEWTHRWSALSACICHHVDGGGVLSKVFAASVRTGHAPLPPLQSQSFPGQVVVRAQGLGPCFSQGHLATGSVFH